MKTGTVLTAAAGVVGAGVAWGAAEARCYTLREVTVPVLAPGAPAVRVLHLSDAHVIPGQTNKVAWVRDLASLQPDLVINTGDNFGHRDALPAVLDALDPLTAFPGAFVFGSNDYYAPVPKNPLRYFLADPRLPLHLNPPDLPTQLLAGHLRDAGWADLRNRRDRIVLRPARAGDRARSSHGAPSSVSSSPDDPSVIAASNLRPSQTIDLVGVDDPHIDRDAFPAPGLAPNAPSPGVTTRNASSSDLTPGTSSPGALPPEERPLRLGVTHAPYARVLAQMSADGVQLVLAGHTHGGQLCVPGFGALVTNCDIDRARVSGLHGWPGARPDDVDGGESLWLHVSSGIGTSPQVRLRFACRPSATLLTLVAQ